MHSLLSCLGLCALVSGLPSPSLSQTSRFIVTLKNTANQRSISRNYGASVLEEWSIIPGFLAEGNKDLYQTLLTDPEVESVEEDGVMQIHGTVDQLNAPWNLARLSSAGPVSGNGTYRYDERAGEGSDVYVVDTGVSIVHSQFGGRATLGYGATDGNGHGTAVAGVIAGTIAGVAKKASIISVKVLSDSGSGSTADVITGLNWVAQAVATSGRPSVVNMSLGGSASTALDNAVVSLVNSGIPVVVSAGGSNTVESSSPARVPQAITVAGSTIADAKASNSNYGPLIDIFAPAVNIYTTYIGSTTATSILTGNSFAAAHVSGLAAYFYSVYGDITGLQTFAQYDVLSGVPPGTPNVLAHNDQNV
ncbi:serine protease [Flagelloscypha sp. PMI_526]|nr:serine protease [Flagelloscypha sp. PMI_526]